MLLEKILLEDDEVVLKTFRKHWWNIVVNVFALSLLTFLPVVVFLFLSTSKVIAGNYLFEAITSWMNHHHAIVLYSYSVWLLGLLMALGNFWTDHYLDVWVVTNRRVLLVDQRGFFSRFISSFRLERLQDMNIEVKGVIPTLLDFGTIEAQTAGGSNEEFIDHMLPHPREIKSLIVRAADELTSTQTTRINNLKEQGL